MKNKNSTNLKTKFSGMIIVLSVLLSLPACEDVIDVNLNDSEPRVVIEAYITNNPEIATVIISKSTDYFTPGEIPFVNGAEVTISDNSGNSYSLQQFDDGIYLSPHVEAEIGRIYTATVTVEGITYTASTMMPQPLTIDSLTSEYQEGGGFGNDEDEGYRLHVFFTDPENIANYGRIKLAFNDSTVEDYFLYDDEFNNGNAIDYSWFFRVFQPGDTVRVELMSMDEGVYDFYRTVAYVVAGDEGGGPDITPANPLTNWDNDALGYFGAYAIEYDTLIVQEGIRNPGGN